jgi:hypothetical protein
LSRIPASTLVTAPIGMATSLRPHRCPSSRSTSAEALPTHPARHPCPTSARPCRAAASSRSTSAATSGSLRSVTIAGRCLPPRVDRFVDRASREFQRDECHQCDNSCHRCS